MNYTLLFDSIKDSSKKGNSRNVDTIMTILNDADLPTTRAVDFYLGLIKNEEGINRLSYYLFCGTQIQRNYCALFFARRNDWGLINRAYAEGCIDKIQAYSR